MGLRLKSPVADMGRGEDLRGRGGRGAKILGWKTRSCREKSPREKSNGIIAMVMGNIQRTTFNWKKDANKKAGPQCWQPEPEASKYLYTYVDIYIYIHLYLYCVLGPPRMTYLLRIKPLNIHVSLCMHHKQEVCFNLG